MTITDKTTINEVRIASGLPPRTEGNRPIIFPGFRHDLTIGMIAQFQRSFDLSIMNRKILP